VLSGVSSVKKTKPRRFGPETQARPRERQGV
jgi:hypothetical protein